MIRFDVVLVPFPFSDLKSNKQRPCLVLASYKPRSLPEHLIVVMMTSQVKKPHFPNDIILSDWEEAGLPLPTLVRLGKFVTVDMSIVRKRIGTLTLKDQKAVRGQFAILFDGLKSA